MPMTHRPFVTIREFTALNSGTSELRLYQIFHLSRFWQIVPPALGAYVLSQHRSKVSSSLSAADAAPTQDEPDTLRINQSSLLTPPAVIHHQAEQIANARRSAAQGSLEPYTIPLLADTQTRSRKNRAPCSLKFTLPAPSVAGAFFFLFACCFQTGLFACFPTQTATHLTLIFFFSCIAERVRDMVGQLLEIRKRCETLIDGRIITGHTQNKTNKQTNKQTNPKPPKTTNTASNNSQNEKVKQIAPLSAPHSISSTM